MNREFLSTSLRYTGLAALVLLAACNQPQPKQKQAQQTQTSAKDTPRQTTVAYANPNTLTLPVLDALFYEPDFTKALKSQLDLSAAQIEKLKSTAHASLRELSEDGVDTASARSASTQYQEKIKAVIGADKLPQLARLVDARYSKGVEGLAPTQSNFVPKDTRIVVNAPAFRLDVFQDGQLIKTYRVGIGYPEFPLPTGMRRADTIIFNPSWTPPDEPWVKGNFAPGRKVSAANELNPLGIIKIPIGMPSLIHGGKPQEKIGNFASHGCVGLTNNMVQDLTAYIAQMGGADLTAAAIKTFGKHRGKTHVVKLATPVPIDLRYETIVAQGGSLHIYRDVYERGTNTLDNAKSILQSYGVRYDQLNEQEQADLTDALDEMNRDPRGKPIADSLAASKNGVAASKLSRSKKGKVTGRIKGEKETAVVIAALQGKGYPAPVNDDDGQLRHP